MEPGRQTVQGEETLSGSSRFLVKDLDTDSRMCIGDAVMLEPVSGQKPAEPTQICVWLATLSGKPDEGWEK